MRRGGSGAAKGAGSAMFLLFVVYVSVFFSGIWFVQWYTFRGQDGMLFLRSRAEESGDYGQVNRLYFLRSAVILSFLLLFLFLLIYGIAYFSDLAGEYGGWLFFGVPVVYFLMITALRLRIRFLMREAKERGEAPLPDVFRVSYTENPERINRLMRGVVLVVFLLCFPIAFISSSYTSSAVGIVLLVILLAILAILIRSVVLEHRNVSVLLEMDSRGILDENPWNSVGFIPWREIRDVSGSDKEVLLTLTKKVPDHPEQHRVAVIKLDLTPVSGSTVRRMIERYRLQAREAEEQKRSSAPEKT